MNTIEKLWMYLLMLIVIGFFTIIAIYLMSEKHVVQYNLKGEYNSGIPIIAVDVENASDYEIQLSKDVTWQEAVHMVDSLNYILHKYPIK